MRIIDCLQGSEEWERWRNRPTASCFHRFIQPKLGGYSTQATKYACELVAKRMNAVRIETFPSRYMEWGTDMEPNAAHAYEKQFAVATEKVGFVLPDHTDAFGGSPDRLVNVTRGDDGHATAEGVVEFKCPAPETLIEMHIDDDLGEMYARPQVQGLLMITGAEWLDFYVWHPDLTPYHRRFEPDVEYQTKIAEHLLRFLGELERVEAAVKPQKHEMLVKPAAKSQLDWGDL